MQFPTLLWGWVSHFCVEGRGWVMCFLSTTFQNAPAHSPPPYTFWPAPSPLWKNVNFSTFWTSCFYSLERRFFVLEYRKRHFPGLNCLKKKVGKMALFGPKPWVNPFGKMSIFRLFELLVFIASKGVFPF